MRVRRLAVLALLAACALPAAAPARTLVRWERSGGLAGLRQRMTVSAKGRVHVGASRAGRERRFRLSAHALRGVRRRLSAARLEDCARRYGPDFPVSDGITEAVEARGRRVEVLTGGAPPRRLQRLLDRLARIAAG